MDTMQRLKAAAEQHEEPVDVFRAQMEVVMDKAVAQAIRNERSGKGKGLRANGLHEVADLLGY